jgi:hypothetical protein
MLFTKRIRSKIKVSKYKKKELNNKIQKMNKELKEFKRELKIDSNYFNEKILEIIPFVIETEGKVTNLEEYMIKLREYFSN